ncbi:unnamed protein product [Phytophthora fragariaefolia]|uniref:Unnamed protein product n=1 Tax=Phytophthora fragariaefolia TaxID=1490495 RepID=A0A9W6WY13_9STRA|nr:unnamed protein product [Phytophthora fragariaefolia]
MAKYPAPNAMSTLLPTTAMAERRYMRILLGVLMFATVIWWLVVLGSANNAECLRLFHSRGKAYITAFRVRGHDSSDDNPHSEKTDLLNQDEYSKAVSKSEVPESSSIDLPSSPMQKHQFKCLGWRSTGDCSPEGHRQPNDDLNCSNLVPERASGYCEVEDINSGETYRVMKRTCAKTKRGAIFRCSDAPGFANFRAETQIFLEEAQSQILAYQMSETTLISRNEIWFSPEEMMENPGLLKPLRQLAQNSSAPHITIRQIRTNGKRIRFNAKVYAIYNSDFEQVLFLDADNTPVKDPSFLFETLEFEKTGAIFWPDYWHPKNTMFYIDSDSLVWQLLDVPFVDMFEQESGQLVIDRRRHAATLALVSFYAFHEPNYFNLQKLAWGDKDLFRFAWLKLEKPFYMIQSPPAVAGKTIDGSFCGLTMVQHDNNGEILFLHRNQRKLMGELHTEIVIPTEKNLSVNEFESPPADGFPDPEIWTHLLTFRNSSARSDFVIVGQKGPRNFPKWQRCYGPQSSDSNFYAQPIAGLSFGGLELQLRKFALEAIGIQQVRHFKKNKEIHPSCQINCEYD